MMNCFFGVPSFLPAPGFPFACFEATDSVGKVLSRVVCHVGLPGVGRAGKPSRSRRRRLSFHPRALPALLYGAEQRRQPSVAASTPAGVHVPAFPAAAPRAAAAALREAPLSRAAALGPANQTRAFPAGAGQWAASLCWKRETLRGKAITKAFHCRQMLSVCADFSCF